MRIQINRQTDRQVGIDSPIEENHGRNTNSEENERFKRNLRNSTEIEEEIKRNLEGLKKARYEQWSMAYAAPRLNYDKAKVM
jgi:hypothetical protein